jgi:hypothetical protein
MCVSIEIMIPVSNEIIYFAGILVMSKLNNVTTGAMINKPIVEIIMMGPDSGWCNFPRCLKIF